MRNIFLDCGLTVRQPQTNTGIQRVVRALCQAMPPLAKANGFDFHNVGFYGGKLCHNSGPGLKSFPAKGKTQGLSRIYSQSNRAHGQGTNPITLQEGDWIFFPDGNWMEKLHDMEMCCHASRKAGAHTALLIHDLIPITHPHLIDPKHVRIFSQWLGVALRLIDQPLAISQATASAVENWMDMAGIYRPAPVPVVHNGWPEHSFGVAPSPLLKPSAGRHFLMVSSLSCHKRQMSVVAEFEKLWKQGHEVCLTLAGRYNFPTDRQRNYLNDHPEMGRRLNWLSEADDDRIAQEYIKSDCVIMASDIEGFGLPILEAWRHGVPVMVNDIAVFREIAGGRAGFFDIANEGALADCIVKFIEQGADPTWIPNDNFWHGWDETAERYVQIFKAAAAPAQAGLELAG